MPALDLRGFADASNGVNGHGASQLKRHKVLPHPREEHLHELYPPIATTKPRELAVDTGIPSIPSSETSSPRTLKHASRRIGGPGLPPTPPTHSRQSSGNHPIVPAPVFDLTPSLPSADTPAAPSTPPNQLSPPTPEVTPPRAVPLAFRPPKHERYPSSRTDSFKTAPENPTSDEEDEESTVRPPLPKTMSSGTDASYQLEKSKKRKEVGLGLGLESDNEGTSTPKAVTNASEREFVVFDGDWAGNSGDGSEVEREWDDNLMRNVTVRKRRPQRPELLTNGHTDEVVEDDIISPTKATRDATRVLRNIPLQERIARHRLEREARTPASPEKVAPRSVDDPESPSIPDVRRFSTMSGRSHASTVIEAMVVDAPPTRRKTLRHMRKRSGLRDVSSDYSTMSSAPTSVVSTEPQHKLHHATARIPEHRHRSLASNGTISTTSSSGRSRREVLKGGGIPVVVVPDRRSSSKSSRAPSLRSTSSRRTKRSMSLNSAPLSQSSKFNEPGYFDVSAPRKRTMSESAGSGHSVRTIDFPPEIPTRRSSLSAPTSRNTSRAGSLTAESLHAHNLVHAKKVESLRPEPVKGQQNIDSQKESSQNTRLSVDHNGDPFFGNRLSTQVTPFSQASYETAGTTAEVSEAMAVSIYPHQNKSVLVVQQRSSSDPSSSQRNSSDPSSLIPKPEEPSQPSQPPLKPLQTSQPTMSLNNNPTTGPVTPPQPSTHPMDAVDSPLRNPRAPPAPPAIKFIPPTPAALTPATEADRQLGHVLPNRPATSSAADDKPARGGLALMRRAFSNRRNSMTAAQPGPGSGSGPGGFLKRTFSLSNRGGVGGRRDGVDEATQTARGTANLNPEMMYPSVADRPADGTKLHPFWRPARFWDDLEGREGEGGSDSGSEDEEDGYHRGGDWDEDGSRRGFPMIDNRPAGLKRGLSGTLKRTFAILPIKDEREGYGDRNGGGTWGRQNRPRFEEHGKMQRTPSGNMRVVKTRSSASLRREAEERRRRMLEARGERARTAEDGADVIGGGGGGYGGGGGSGSGNEARGIKVPGLSGVRVEYVGWSGLKRRFSEKRRERRADVLRRSISAPRGVRSGVDDVLRGRE